MKILPTSILTKVWDEKNDLFTQQTAHCASRAPHFPRVANLRGCILPENHSQ